VALTGNLGRRGAGWQFANLQTAVFDEVKDPVAFYPPERPDGVARIAVSTARLGADMLATICPMCQMNIDLYQAEVNRRFKTDFKIPILFFTQLLGLAFGMDAKELGIGSEVVSSRRALAKIGITVPEPPEGEAVAAGAPAEKPRVPRARKGPELPMPHMPKDEGVGL
jgi:heterodisulfide reductase subunit B